MAKSVKSTKASVEVKSEISEMDLIFQAVDLGLDLTWIRKQVKNGKDIEDMIADQKSKIAEAEEIDSLVKESSLNKQEKNLVGFWLYGAEGWNRYTTATTAWLKPMATISASEEFVAFISSNKRLKDVEAFLEYLQK